MKPVILGAVLLLGYTVVRVETLAVELAHSENAVAVLRESNAELTGRVRQVTVERDLCYGRGK